MLISSLGGNGCAPHGCQGNPEKCLIASRWCPLMCCGGKEGEFGATKKGVCAKLQFPLNLKEHSTAAMWSGADISTGKSDAEKDIDGWTDRGCTEEQKWDVRILPEQ
ncbi:hypothetical protein Y1Q_0000239 [Alligator mississippiensis]|uniref:Uncharacterized protein n=1 Tax=Alligator mississippiensis TaxID=8496 RepID=A0A151P1K7_ALLMI|nr:hypothetical protein Y1Q_0000239 [Alligator mississippiensis]